MKTNLKRMVVLLLAVIICLNIAACSNAPSWDGKWEITDADYENMKIAKVISTENDGTRYVTLSAEDISYKSEVKSDSVRVVAYPVSKASVESLSTNDTAQSSEELFKETLIEGVTAERKDDKTLELSFKEPEYDYYCMYLYYVHKEAVDGNAFVLGFDNICLEESTTPEAKITTNLKNGQENPTLELKLTNAKTVENIKAEEITLSGAFENLKATAVTSDGDTITIKTEGEVEVTSAAYGYVQLSENATDAGAKILAISDDAYFGLNYENDIEPESLFAKTCDLDKNILAVKIDGPTKEDFVWGFRSGFITFGNAQMSDEQYSALITKLMGIIRSSVSCSSTPPQSLLLRAMKDPETEKQKQEYRKILEERYAIVRNFVDTHSCSCLKPLPFNSGYFMSFEVIGKDAELLRKKILQEYGIGTVSIDSKTLRVAFSSIEKEKLENVYTTIYKAAEEL